MNKKTPAADAPAAAPAAPDAAPADHPNPHEGGCYVRLPSGELQREDD